uniref:Uncharacterized protein n=1 Tax=Chromera velia CCMP2878 TaxID=1169474 RepID=A0A0G4F8K0_9ALVE|eukprot:Cvel_15588.t1-p1 / transcript=Cvel_15588.t1 / gene=Cvel_15588 / organism=Chromera_velia_CCMP2878 / gene_product=hypothetical protein / transcript_product=hypothetical protein / location=Cvel_scaffold1159:22693-23690(+) / protein_length=226 / sequence_SO=supercontig / SO=protein_coding / is_pseudo=false
MSSAPPISPEKVPEARVNSLPVRADSEEVVCQCGRCLAVKDPFQPLVPMKPAAPEESQHQQNVSPTCALAQTQVVSLVTQREFVLGSVENSHFLNNRQRKLSARQRMPPEGQRTNASRRQRLEAMRATLPFLLHISYAEGEMEQQNPNTLAVPQGVPMAPRPSILSPPAFPREVEGGARSPFPSAAGGFANTILRPVESTCMPESASSRTDASAWTPLSAESLDEN